MRSGSGAKGSGDTPEEAQAIKVAPRWHKAQVTRYIAELPRYRQYAAVLEEILKRACDLYAPLAIVQARPKSVTSFAEKAAPIIPDFGRGGSRWGCMSNSGHNTYIGPRNRPFTRLCAN
jgi:hypothetical protein